MSGARDLALSLWPRSHGSRRGWQWALITYDVCVATGWVEGTREDARKAAQPARDAYLAKLEAAKKP